MPSARRCYTWCQVLPSGCGHYGGREGEKLGEELISMESKRERKRENDKRKRERKIKEERDGK